MIIFKMKNSNENIIFYRSWWSSLAVKSPEFRHAVLDAVFAYAFDEIAPSFPTESGQQIAFENMSSFIDQNREKFAKKKEQRKAAIEARWAKQKGDDNTKNTNVFETIQNEFSYSPARPNKDKVKDNEKEKDNVKDKDNDSKEIDTLSLSQLNKNIASAEADGERERVIFDYALFLLTEGRVSAYSNAVAAWDYNMALGWNRETLRKDGSVVRQPIRYKLSWLKNREQKPPQEFEAEHGAALAAILRRSGMLPENASIIDDFRGFGIRDGCVYFLYAYITKAVRAFSLAIRKNQKINNIVTQELTRAFPGSESFAVIAKNNF